MNPHLFWFTDEQRAKIEPHLPTNRRGRLCHNDRQISSGIMHFLKIGGHSLGCPREYSPSKTIYNHFVRWSDRGIQQKMFESVAVPCEPPGQIALDSSQVNAPAAPAAERGPNFKRSGSRWAAEIARYTRLSTNA